MGAREQPTRRTPSLCLVARHSDCRINENEQEKTAPPCMRQRYTSGAAPCGETRSSMRWRRLATCAAPYFPVRLRLVPRPEAWVGHNAKTPHKARQYMKLAEQRALPPRVQFDPRHGRKHADGNCADARWCYLSFVLPAMLVDARGVCTNAKVE